MAEENPQELHPIDTALSDISDLNQKQRLEYALSIAGSPSGSGVETGSRFEGQYQEELSELERRGLVEKKVTGRTENTRVERWLATELGMSLLGNEYLE